MRKKVLLGYTVVLGLLLCMTASSCLSVLSTISGLIFNFSDELSDDDRCIVYGSENELSVTFVDNKMMAIWDTEETYSYTLSVKCGDDTQTFSSETEGFSVGSCDLSLLGYTYEDLLQLTLTRKKGTSNTEYGYTYTPLTDAEYRTFTKPVAAGFTEIDYYIATRKEWFDFFSYLIVFREDAKTEKDRDGTSYVVEKECYLAYTFTAYPAYSDLTAKEAYANEVYSAIDAYEDSASYAYSYELEEDERTAQVYMKFYYPTDPVLETESAKTYRNATKVIDPVHYTIGTAHTRSFPVDAVQKTISVRSSDQLYFALKKGYRPVPEAESQAEFLYRKMRSVLAELNEDKDSDYTKVHRIYDYIVDMTVYDYKFTSEIMKDEDLDSDVLFAYKCLYLEGVFGLQEDGTFDENGRAAICDGLSKAFLCMAKIEGVDCIKVSGTVRNKRSTSDTGHAWNKVKIDNVWYLVDTTWGNELADNGITEYLNHDYFLKKDDTDHEETPYIAYPAAHKNYGSFGRTEEKNPFRSTMRM